jgi:putative endonuclease
MLFKKLFTTKQKGDFGEKKAAAYLRRKGYRIIERNYRNRFCEIDIIAFKKVTYVFAEVKSRSGDEFGTPAQAVDARRRERMVRAAKMYMIGNENFSVRFDVIEVYLKENRINHYENAFDSIG